VIDIGGLVEDLDFEVANIARDLLDLAVGVETDHGVGPHRDHLWGEDAGRAVQGGEGLVQLGHVSAYGLEALHEMDPVSGIRDIQGRLDPRYSAADNQDIGQHRDLLGGQGLVKGNPCHSGPDDVPCLIQGGPRLIGDPGAVLSDVGYLEEIWIYACGLARLAKGPLVHPGGTGSHNDPVQAVVLDVLSDLLLSRFGTHEAVIAGDRDAWKASRITGKLLDVYLPCDVGAAVTDIDPCAGGHATFLRIPSRPGGIQTGRRGGPLEPAPSPNASNALPLILRSHTPQFNLVGPPSSSPAQSMISRLPLPRDGQTVAISGPMSCGTPALDFPRSLWENA
jgi:hypothetical protein